MILEKFKEAMFKPINTAAISIMGVFTLLWGFWVGNPWWEVFTQAELFSFMTSLLPEWAWGLFAALIGISMLYGVMKPSYMNLRNGALAGFYFWLFASINFFIGDWRNTGGITLLMISIYCGYIALNIYINKLQFIATYDHSTENLAFRKDE